MPLAEILNMRYRWEQLVENLNWNPKESTVEDLQYFVQYSHKNNRFRKGWQEAMKLASDILDYHNAGKIT